MINQGGNGFPGQRPMGGGMGQQQMGQRPMGQPGMGQRPMGGMGQPPRAPMGGMGGGMGGGFAPRAPMGGGMGQPRGAVQQQRQRDDLSWTKSGQVAQAVSSEISQRNDQRKAEARERGYWPNQFYLRATPGPTGQDHIGQVVILDANPAPHFWLHVLKNPKTGYSDVMEPCPKELESCPLCPPNGRSESNFVMLLTVLNLKGYVKNGGTHIHPTKELMVVKQSQHATYHRLAQNFGTLRGLQLTLIRDSDKSPRTGNLDAATPVVQHSDQDIEAYLGQNGKLRPLVSQKDGSMINPDPRHMMFPFDYGTFVHRPSGERLRRLYGGAAPMGSAGYGGNDQGQWGGGGYTGNGGGYDNQYNGYQPETAQMPNGYTQQGGDQGQWEGQGGYQEGQTSQGYDGGYAEQGQTDMGNGGPADMSGAQDQQMTIAQQQGSTGAQAQNSGFAVRTRGAPPQGGQGQQAQQGQQQQPGRDNWMQNGGGYGGGQPGGPDMDDEIPF